MRPAGKENERERENERVVQYERKTECVRLALELATINYHPPSSIVLTHRNTSEFFLSDCSTQNTKTDKIFGEGKRKNYILLNW
jgi:hypothetical protein